MPCTLHTPFSHMCVPRGVRHSTLCRTALSQAFLGALRMPRGTFSLIPIGPLATQWQVVFCPQAQTFFQQVPTHLGTSSSPPLFTSCRTLQSPHPRPSSLHPMISWAKAERQCRAFQRSVFSLSCCIPILSFYSVCHSSYRTFFVFLLLEPFL